MRLRVEISNEGTADDPGPTTYLLEYATSTAGPWTPVEVASVATNSHWQMTDSSYYGDGVGSNNMDPGLTDENGSWLTGKLKDTSTLTAALTLTTSQFTEIEYCFQATSNATPGATYYFRLTDNGTELNNYQQYGEVTLNGGGSWFNSNWLYRKHLRIDSSRVAGNLTNFPVLINTTDLDWRDSGNSGHVAQADGGDILFTAGDGVTKLDHEIESYNEITGELVAWVEVPSLSGSADTGLYIYYGNSTLAAGDNQWNANGTWDEGGSGNFKGVWHLEEVVTNEQTTGTHEDSTSYGNDGDQNNNGNTASGKIGGAQDFDGADDYVDLGSPAALNLTTTFSVTAWVKWRATGVDQVIYASGSVNGDHYRVDVNNCNTDGLSLREDGEACHPANSTLLPANTWHHVAVVKDGDSGTNVTFYLDGVSDGTASAGTSGANGLKRIGARTESTDMFFDGFIDEVRISSVARTAEWIETEYNNQKAPAAFYTVGIEETPGAGDDPFNNGWSYRKRMSIDGAQISSNLINFPVLVKTTDPDLIFGGGHVGQADFDDILFTAANGTMKLDHEIERSRAPAILTSTCITATVPQ
jgi:hypothetical protein